MRTKKTELYVHLAWSAWNGEPALGDLDCGRLYEVLREIAGAMSVELLEIGGTENHLHLLAHIPSALPINHLAMHLKAASALFINQTMRPDGRFRWHGSYSAFTVSPSDTARVADYIHRQEELHVSGSFDAAAEPE